MDVKEKLAQAKEKESNVQLIAVFLKDELDRNADLATGFERDDFTWEMMEEFIYDKVSEVAKEKKPGARVMAVRGQTVLEWAKEFFLLSELPKKPEPTKAKKPETAKPKAEAKKEDAKPKEGKSLVGQVSLFDMGTPDEMELEVESDDDPGPEDLPIMDEDDLEEPMEMDSCIPDEGAFDRT